MKMKKIKGYVKKTLSAGVLSAFLLGGFANAEEIDIRRKYPRTSALEERVSILKPKINFVFEIKKNDYKAPIFYSTSKTDFENNDELWRSSNVPELSSSEETQVENIMKDIKYKDINSYQDFIKTTDVLTENQKIVLFSAIAHLLNKYNYDLELIEADVVSQDTFFEKLQDSLISSKKNGIGTCGHISSHTEQLANDAGVRASQVSGIRGNSNHMFVILKIENGSAIVDSYDTLITNAKNVEKILEVYQKHVGNTAFKHIFMEDAEFKYKLITKDGRNFFDFIEYDESLNPLKNYLTSENELVSPKLSIDLDLESYLKSFKFNYKGFFTKIGEIRGDSNSPMNKATLFQTGFKRKFLTPSFDNISLNTLLGNKIIDFDGNFLFGNLSEDAGYKKIRSINGNLILATNNEKGFNLGFRIAGNSPSVPIEDETFEYYSLHSDFLISAGTSYKIESRKINIQPYVVAQSSMFPEDVSTIKWKPRLSQLVFGNIFDVKVSTNINFSLDPHYTWRIWEDEFGLAAGFGNGNIKASAEGYFTKSKYDFCPDKIGFKTELEAKLRNLNLKAGYEGKRTNYDGEKEWDNSLNASVNIKY